MTDDYLDIKRKEIADTDREIIILLRKRLDLATEIGHYKAQNGLGVRNLDVEQRVVDRYRYLAAEYDMDPDRMEKICRTIMQESVANEEALQGCASVSETPADAPVRDTVRPDAEPVRKQLVLTGLVSVLALIALTAAVALCMYSDNVGRIVYIMAVPVFMIALCYYLGFKDAADAKDADSLAWVRKRSFIFGLIMTAISAVVLALFAVA